MNVLSLFDGMSCGQIALNRANIKYDKYFASEIDKYAIKVTQENYPNTIQLGDVKDWATWELPEIELLLAGSPCQGFSVAGNHLNFEDPRSVLFFDFVAIKKYINPKYWLLENVNMKKEWRDIISNVLKVEPIRINSNLVSAQNRDRLYWTNIPNVTQPEDKHIYLKDVLDSDGEGAIIDHGEVKPRTDKSQCIDANYFKGADNHGQRTVICVASRGRYNPDGSTSQRIEPRNDGKTNALTTVQKDNLVAEPHAFTEARTEEAKLIRRKFMQETGKDWCPRRGKKLVPRDDGKSNCLTTGLTKEHNLFDGYKIRNLTPNECERLQTVPLDYTKGVSNTQRYKMLGNGWTVDVITHILKGM